MKAGRLESRFASVVAMIALFVAMGGTAIALKNNEVKSKHIKDGQVKSGDLKDDSIKSKDIRNGQIKGSDVKGDSLGAAEIDEADLGQVPDAEKVGGVEVVTIDFRQGTGAGGTSYQLGDLVLNLSCEVGYDLEVSIFKPTPDSGSLSWMAGMNDNAFASDVFALFTSGSITLPDAVESGSTGQISYQDNDSVGSADRNETRHIVTIDFLAEEKIGEQVCLFTGHARISEA